MSDKKAIGRRLKSGITDAGITIDDFAVLVGTSRQSVSDWINGRTGMGFENAVKVCDVLGWPLDKLAVRGDYDDQPSVGERLQRTA